MAAGTSDEDEDTFESGLVEIGEFQYEESDETSKLGEGKYGVVYRGRRKCDEQEVALKKVPPTAVKADELDLIRRINCQYIVSYLGIVSLDPDTSYIAMELCDMDMTTFLDRFRKLSDYNLDLTATCLAQGYLALSQNNIVHRDLKPENLLLKLGQERITTASPVTPSKVRRFSRMLSRKLTGLAPEILAQIQPQIGVVKITDFGCSRLVKEDAEDFSNVAGTFYYMAPEVGANLVEESFYDAKVDMWSLGVVFYQCAVGAVPFEENQLCKLFLKASDQNYAGFAPPILRDGPKSYRDFVPRLIQINPEKRLTPIQFYDFVIEQRPLPSMPMSRKRKKHSSKTKRNGSRHSSGVDLEKKNAGSPIKFRSAQGHGNSVKDHLLYYGCCFCCCRQC